MSRLVALALFALLLPAHRATAQSSVAFAEGPTAVTYGVGEWNAFWCSWDWEVPVTYQNRGLHTVKVWFHWQGEEQGNSLVEVDTWGNTTGSGSTTIYKGDSYGLSFSPGDYLCQLTLVAYYGGAPGTPNCRSFLIYTDWEPVTIP